MKTIGSILCVVAALRIVSLLTLSKAATTAERVQDWALAGVILAFGIAFSVAKKSDDSGEE